MSIKHLEKTNNSKSKTVYRIICKSCKKFLGYVNWLGVTPTDEIRCSKCALKEFGIE